MELSALPRVYRVIGQIMLYENDMHIFYDTTDHRVTVMFRSDLFVMLGPYVDRWDAIRAAEQECRLRGWGKLPYISL